MEYLLDTHTFLWFINGDKELSDRARETIEKPEAIKYISIASFWEVAIKLSIGKLTLDMPFDELKGHVSRNGFEFLPVTFEHTAALIQLNFYHKDPFDRILIAQALTERLTIISRTRTSVNTMSSRFGSSTTGQGVSTTRRSQAHNKRFHLEPVKISS